MEEWKDIPGYEKLYQASTHGRIRSAPGKITSNKRYVSRVWKVRILKGKGNNPKTGARASLWKDGTRKDYLVARLVALTFLGTPPEGYTVNHIDGNRLNNNIENLEWLSLADNIKHGFENGLYPQKSVMLESENKQYKFRSLAQCDRFLNRCDGYTSGKLKKNSLLLTDKSGNRYKVAQDEIQTILSR